MLGSALPLTRTKFQVLSVQAIYASHFATTLILFCLHFWRRWSFLISDEQHICYTLKTSSCPNDISDDSLALAWNLFKRFYVFLIPSHFIRSMTAFINLVLFFV